MARVGRYELLGRLATGGMAELFLARAEGIEGFSKIVVLKRILPGRSKDDDFVKMFLQEARLAGTLHHSNIVQVYDIGVEDGSYYFTMEFLRGKDLRDLARTTFRNKKRVPLPIVVQIIAGIAAGLHYAHEKCDADGEPLQLVHRDVSPANVFVTWDGGVKLVDFGIAKAASAESTTQVGTLKGKVPYMSPEQCQGKSLDRRSDIFSLGTLLWEYSIGRRLWKGEHELMTIKKIANEAPTKPSDLWSDYPPELEKIVLKALANDREERYQTAQELQLALEEFARDMGWVMSSAKLSHYLLEIFPEQTTIDTVVGGLEPVSDAQTEVDGAELAPPARDSSVSNRWRIAAAAVGVLGVVGIVAATTRGAEVGPVAYETARLAEVEESVSADDGASSRETGIAAAETVPAPVGTPTDVRNDPVAQDAGGESDAGDPGAEPEPAQLEPPSTPKAVETTVSMGKKSTIGTKAAKKKKKKKKKKPSGPVDPDALFPPD